MESRVGRVAGPFRATFLRPRFEHIALCGECGETSDLDDFDGTDPKLSLGSPRMRLFEKDVASSRRRPSQDIPSAGERSVRCRSATGNHETFED